jgi:TolA-binding protein
MSDDHANKRTLRTGACPHGSLELGSMAKNPLSQLASLGEEVIGKAAQNPTAARLIQTGAQLKDRVDELSKRVRGLEAMEKRIEELEQRLEKVERRQRSAARKKPAPPAGS